MTKPNKALIAIAFTGIAAVSLIVLSSWEFRQYAPFYEKQQKAYNDTIPDKDKTEKKIRDLDDVLMELDAADLKLNLENIQNEISEAMKSIDMDKIKLDMEKAMRDIDFEKMKKEINESVAKIDFEKMKDEMAEEMAKMKIDLEKVKDINIDKLEIDMKKMKEELSKMGPELEKSLQKAKVEIEKAKAEMKEYKEFVDGLEKDGQIDKKSGYMIKHAEGVLTINGKKASPEVYNKYKSFLEKHKKFEIKKSDDDFNIHLD